MVSNDIVPMVRHPRARSSSSPRSASAPPASNGRSPEREDRPSVDDKLQNARKTLLLPISAPISTLSDDTLGGTTWPSPSWDDGSEAEDNESEDEDDESDDEDDESEDEDGDSEDEDDESDDEDDESDDEDDESEDESVHNQAALGLNCEVKKRERVAAHFKELLAVPESQTAPDEQIAPDGRAAPDAHHRPREYYDEEPVVGVRFTWDNPWWPGDVTTAGEGALGLTESIYCTLLVIVVMVGLDHLWHAVMV